MTLGHSGVPDDEVGVSTRKTGPGFCRRSLKASQRGGRLPH